MWTSLTQSRGSPRRFCENHSATMWGRNRGGKRGQREDAAAIQVRVVWLRCRDGEKQVDLRTVFQVGSPRRSGGRSRPLGSEGATVHPARSSPFQTH